MLSLVVLMLSAACGSTMGNSSSFSNQKVSTATQASSAGSAQAVTPEKVQGKKILVAYFSRTGDNYAVGNISKGNTHIVADMIAEATGADTFEMKTVKPYPENYRECTEVAKKELADNVRPELTTKVENMQDYDVIFLGYPIWWSDMPMAIYSFMESYDFKGKTIIPFCTSAGDVLTGKESSIPNYAKGAKILPGLGIEGKRAQEKPDSVRPEVQQWLAKLGFAK
ncbi:flavodoxin/nitric oxide synthase [Lucifera butyrica]|uniref:Flavodoxin/nitric oxide synthase n=2 Tax=Lucifera butyrica TaxID=1351585 RepID=A0A498REV1_9FIRM|nr:flavodoxin/nitric oxide synthase [Lucifera butyrica]